MKRNMMLTYVALLMVVLVGAGGAFWALKKYRAKQRQDRQEFRYEGKMGQAREGFNIDGFKQEALSDEMLDQVIQEHQLIAVWGVADASAAKNLIKQKFIVKLDGAEVIVSYQDKNKELAQKMLQSIVHGYYVKVNGVKPTGQQAKP